MLLNLHELHAGDSARELYQKENKNSPIKDMQPPNIIVDKGPCPNLSIIRRFHGHNIIIQKNDTVYCFSVRVSGSHAHQESPPICSF